MIRKTTRSHFGELDELVLDLKGLVLVRDLRKRGHANQEELEIYGAEIGRVRDRLADLVRNSGGGCGFEERCDEFSCSGESFSVIPVASDPTMDSARAAATSRTGRR